MIHNPESLLINQMIELIFTIECVTKHQGLSIEKHIKSMKSRIYIQNLLKYPEMKFKLLEKYK